MSIKSESLIAIKILSKNKEERTSAIKHLYDSTFESVERYITQNSGSSDDAKDIFQDAVTVVYQNILSKKFKNQSSVETYLSTICRNLWLMELRKNKKKTVVSISSEVNPIQDEESSVNLKRMLKLLGKLGSDCQNVLKAYYFQSKTMNEIKSLFNLGSIQAAKNKKLRCMKSLTQLVHTHRLTQNDFLD